MATLEFTVGRLLCSPVRTFLNKRQFAGDKIEFFEGEGWFSREFVIRGDASTLHNIQHSINEWAKEINNPHPAQEK